MKITPVEATLGAIVEDVELAQLTDADFEDIEAAWHQHGVLVFRNQHLSNEEHLAFSKRFGRLEMGLKRGPSSGLAHMSNITKDGGVAKTTSLQHRFHLGNTYWHSDSSYKSVGAKASLLAAHVVPEEGGETEWADMRAAYDVLDDEMKAYLDSKGAVHSYVYSHTWHGGLEIISEEDVKQLPPVVHPIVRTHAATGRKNLFVGRHASHIVGEDEEASRALLKKLTEDACQSPRTWKYKWQPGDVCIWDNRCVLHRGHMWPEDQKRYMIR
ncbi:MAG: TauD/TfdA family dioxygenase, partial [Pseudomonadota bacterium]